MKKQKLIIRIISIALLIVMVLGMIIPYVAASEVEPDVERPEYALPDGFDYEFNGHQWEIVKTKGNNQPAIMLDARPESFDATKIVIFVGNMETYEVKAIELFHHRNFVASMDIEDGYYVVFTNNYAWCDSDGNAYAVNGGYHQFIYVGDDYNPNLYGIEFQQTNGIFSLALGDAASGMETIAHGSSPIINDVLLRFPEDAKLEKNEQGQDQEQPGATTPSTPQDETKPNEDLTPPTPEKKTFLQIIWALVVNVVGGSPLLWIGIVACFVSLKVIDIKKKAKIAQQTENDMYDERRVD